jgi:hypothetical protein
MNSRIFEDLKRELKIPTARQSMIILISVISISVSIALLQGLIRPVIENRFMLESVSFPLAIQQIERAGEFSNLIGWGYFLNGYRIEAWPWWMAENVIVILLTIGFARLLWWGPVSMTAGAFANLLEWHFLGNVLDWIIFPNGAYGVRALSLGDILIYGGLVPCVIVLSLMMLRIPLSVWLAVRNASETSKGRP